MSETLRVIATIAIVVAGFIALISALSAFLEFLAPAAWEEPINNILMLGSSYIQTGRGLLNYFVLSPAVISGCLLLTVFAKPVIWAANLVWNVIILISKGF